MVDVTKKKVPTTTVRLPDDLHAEIKAAAAAAGHSMNTEIIERLRHSFIGATIRDVVRQNEKTHEMVQQIIDAISPKRR
jgi:plasmid stability protein